MDAITGAETVKQITRVRERGERVREGEGGR